MIPGRVDHLLLGERDDWELELALPVVYLLLGLEGVDIREDPQQPREQGGAEQYPARNPRPSRGLYKA